MPPSGGMDLSAMGMAADQGGEQAEQNRQMIRLLEQILDQVSIQTATLNDMAQNGLRLTG